MTPQRIQRRRTKGWKMPEGAIYVGRPTKWGNPFKITPERTRSETVIAHEIWMWMDGQVGLRDDARRELRGHDLVCWCKPGKRCHADVLLRIANED